MEKMLHLSPSSHDRVQFAEGIAASVENRDSGERIPATPTSIGISATIHEVDEMQETVVTIVNPLGLHARAAAQVVSLCSRYVSNIVLSAGDKRANGRQFIAMILLSASMGAKVTLQIAGPDEVEAMTAVTRLISNGFGEG
jgi:phosphocarrier protein HPr